MKPPYKSELRARQPPAVDEESRKIHKNRRKPVVIYMVSPEVIHADASEFMALVQRLTGPGSGAPAEEAAAPSASARPSTSGHGGDRRQQQLPVRVKARALNRQPEAAAGGETLFFHDLSPPSSAVRKDEQAPPMAPHSWLLHGEYLDQSPPRHQQGFLDVFGGQEQDR